MAKKNIQKTTKKQLAVKHEKPAVKAFPGGIFVAVALIILASVICYLNSFGCSFHFDDIPIIPDNPAIRDISNVTAWYSIIPSRPVGIFTLVLNYAVGGNNVWGYHLVNLLIHMANGLLVFWMLLLIFKTPAITSKSNTSRSITLALIAALLFVSHPLQTQAVTYIVQRLASLAAMFFLLSVCFYIKARITNVTQKKRIILFLASGLSAILAFLTKENTYALPLIIVMVEFFFIRQNKLGINFRDWKLWAFAGLTGVLAVIMFVNFSFSIFSPILPEQGHTYTVTSATYLLTQFRVLTTYLRLVVLPFGQNLDYDYPISQSIFELKTMASFLFMLSLLVIAVLSYKKLRMVSFGIFWFFITIAIESSIIPVPNLIFEHRMYLPSIGLFMIIVSLTGFITDVKIFKAVRLLLFLLVPVLCILTISRNRVWKDEFTLWEDVAKKSPEKTRPLMNFANSLRDKKRYAEAMPYYDKAIKNNPRFDAAYLNRGKNRSFMKDFAGALLDYQAAVLVNPSSYGGYNNCGLAKYELGNYAGALADLNIAIHLFPPFADAYNNRANVKSGLKDFDGSLRDFETSIRLNPNSPQPYNNRASVRFEMNDADGALQDINRALSIKPDYPDAYNNRANIMAARKDYAASISDFDQVLRLDPNADYAYCNRGTSKFFMNDKTGACADWTTAAQMGNGEAASYINQFCK